MMGSMIKGHLEQFLSEYAKPGYEFEFNSSGAILSNVELKPEAILPSSLPVYVVSGFIEKVEFTLPLTSLNSKPVEIRIHDVLIIVKLKNESVWSAQDELEAFAQERHRAAACEWGEDPLQLRLEEFMKMYFDQDSQGYKAQFTKMFQRVVNNVTIDMKHFHVRYEDQHNDATHAIGLNVEHLVSHGTNDQWEVEFQSSGDVVRRRVKLENVHMYCDANSKSVVKPQELDMRKCLISGKETMKRILEIEKESHVSASKTLQWWDSTSTRAHHYLISPLSAVSFQITSNVPTDIAMGSGSVSCHMESDPVALQLDTEQIVILGHFLNTVHLYAKWQHVVRRNQHFMLLADISDEDSMDYQRLVYKKTTQPLFMSKDETTKLEELQVKFPLYRLNKLRKRNDADTDGISIENDTPREVVVEFQQGSLGMDVEVNPQKFGHRMVRVNGCVPGSQADRSGLIQPGFVISKVGNVQTDDCTYDQVLELLTSTARPFPVVFRTIPKESMLTHHDAENQVSQQLTFTAQIESYSVSFVAHDIRREVLRILGSGLKINSIVQLSSMGVATSIHGSFATDTAQFSDRWNPSASFESQCIVNIVGMDNAPAAEISFVVPLVSELGINTEFEEPSRPHILCSVANVDLCIIIEHWNKLLWCLDVQHQRIKQGRAAIRISCGFIPDVPLEPSPSAISDVDLGVELLPSPVATILSGMITGPATTTEVTFGSFETTFYAKFISMRCLRKDTCTKTAYECAAAIRAARLHCVTSENGAFLHLIEASVHAVTFYCIKPKSTDLLPQFVAGYVSHERSVGATFEEECEYIKNLGAGDTVECFSPKNISRETIPQISLSAELSQDANVSLHNQVAMVVNVNHTEILMQECIFAISNYFDMITPISRYMSLIPIQPQARRFYFTKATGSCANVAIVLTDRPEMNGQLFGYQLNGQVRYTCNDEGEESGYICGGPVYVGLYGENSQTFIKPYEAELNFHRVRKEHGGFELKFANAKKECEHHEIVKTVNQNRGHWVPLPASTISLLFHQLQSDCHIRWPMVDGSPLALHEWAYKIFMANPNALIDQAVWSVVNQQAAADSSSSSLSSYTTIYSGSAFDNLNLSSVVYQSTEEGDIYLPTIVKTTEMLELVCKRSPIISCTLHENPNYDIYWKARDVEILSRYCSSLTTLHISGAQLTTMDLSTFTPMEHLTNITLTKCDIGNEVMEKLIVAAPKLKSLELIEISSLTSFEIASKTIERLTLHECVNIRDHVVSQVLATAPVLSYLSLEGCRELRHVVFESDSLEELNVTGCTCLEDKSITMACASCPKLSTLNCTWCYQLIEPRIVGQSLSKVVLFRCTGLLDSVITTMFSENMMLVCADLSGFKRHCVRHPIPSPVERTDWVTSFLTRKKAQRIEAPPRFNIASNSLRELLLEDCTSLNDVDVTLLTSRCPRLESLNLNFCTDLENPVIVSDSLHSVSARYASKLSTHAAEVMLTNCPNLKTINLQGCATVDGNGLHPNSSQIVHVIGTRSLQSIKIQS